MPCVRFKPRKMTFGEAKDILGMSRVYRAARGESAKSVARVQADWDRAHAEVVPRSDEPVWLCGPGTAAIVFCSHPDCDYESESLCDWPMGRGKTCDLALCDEHRRHIGDDRDLCAIHFAMWVEKTRTDRLNPWPPPR